MSFTRTHAILLVICIGLEVLGFWMLAQAPWDNPISRTYAPILLSLVFFVGIPVAIFWPSKEKVGQSQKD
jgi:hypothetical protein